MGNREKFRSWMLKNTNLALSTVEKYTAAINSISDDLSRKNILEFSLFKTSDPVLVEEINNKYFYVREFKDKDEKGNRMYSSALKYYRKFTQSLNEQNGKNYIYIKDKDMEYLTFNKIVQHIHTYITSKGFLYTKEEITNLFLSLKSKPFVILSGISGTGKTKMVQWFAESVGANEDNGQFMLIPLRPDWNDGSDLLGYKDIKGDFIEGPLTKVIKRANEYPNKPYFVLLDEMNLARVEYYFSDILSVMESRKWKDGEIVSSYLLTEEAAGFNLKLPNNLYIIGTVNMDETTHPFSKKVLDRANTIELNEVNLGNFAFLNEQETVESIDVPHERLASNYLHLQDVFQKHQKIVEDATNELVRINKTLQKMHAHIGYRVRDEICFYLAYNEEAELFTFNQAFDYCVLQKVLPRIAGSDTRVKKMLQELYTIFTNKVYDDGQEDVTTDIKGTKYPRSAAKVAEMLRRFEEDGFTSFWVS